MRLICEWVRTQPCRLIIIYILSKQIFVLSEKGAFCSGGCGLHAVCYNETCQCMEGFKGDPRVKCSGNPNTHVGKTNNLALTQARISMGLHIKD